MLPLVTFACSASSYQMKEIFFVSLFLKFRLVMFRLLGSEIAHGIFNGTDEGFRVRNLITLNVFFGVYVRIEMHAGIKCLNALMIRVLS